MRRVEEKQSCVQDLMDYVSRISVLPSTCNDFLESIQSATISQKVKFSSLLLRPEISLSDLMTISQDLSDYIKGLPPAIADEVCNSAEIAIKYSRYIEKEKEVADRILKYEDLPIKKDLDYSSITALSFEAREKLSKMRPSTIGQASRISGVSPSDISVLLVLMNS